MLDRPLLVYSSPKPPSQVFQSQLFLSLFPHYNGSISAAHASNAISFTVVGGSREQSSASIESWNVSYCPSGFSAGRRGETGCGIVGVEPFQGFCIQCRSTLRTTGTIKFRRIDESTTYADECYLATTAVGSCPFYDCCCGGAGYRGYALYFYQRCRGCIASCVWQCTSAMGCT